MGLSLGSAERISVSSGSSAEGVLHALGVLVSVLALLVLLVPRLGLVDLSIVVFVHLTLFYYKNV